MAGENQLHESFLKVFLRHEEDLRSYARALLPHWDAVGEVMQEASVVMWRKLDQLRDESEFLPWAKVIVRYEALKARQTAARDRLCFSDEVFELLAASDDDPGEEAMRRKGKLSIAASENSTRLRRALSSFRITDMAPSPSSPMSRDRR